MSALHLPPMRQDLALYPAPPQADGSPSWHLHDPAANRYYQLGWIAFEVLSRWHLRNPAAIVAAMERETTLSVDTEAVAAVAEFLEHNHLLEASQPRDSARLLKARRAGQLHWAKWLLHNYLFFRIPLVRPDRWLARHVGIVRPFMNPLLWGVVAALGVLALAQVARHWESFIYGFTAYSGWQTALAFGLALSVAKVFHELGHALVAKHYGCKVPTMGVAFLVLWPVLYTDTNEAWKLPSHRQRRNIALAGMAAETLTAVVATWLWLLLPEGPLRAAVLFLATTSWLMTMALNVSPFMRFDGYFLLADMLGLPNLHERAFAFGRWWLREKLFGFGLPAPEPMKPHGRRLMVLFAFCTWTYRLILFLSIALLVYHFFFKVLGILLMLVELWWFIARPVMREIKHWWQSRHGMRANRATGRTLLMALLLIGWIVLPWDNEISAPAIAVPAREQQLTASQPARIDAVLRDSGTVAAGEELIRLAAPELDFRLAQARINEAALRNQVSQQAFDAGLTAQGDSLRSRWQEAVALVSGLEAERERLVLRAAFSGEIAFRSDQLVEGTWVTAREPLLAIVDRQESRVEAYVGESDLQRLKVGAQAEFVPETLELPTRGCRIADIDRVNLAVIEDPALASTQGGPLPARSERNGTFVPVNSVYRVWLDQCTPANSPALRVRGTAHLDADPSSPISTFARRVVAIFVREAGF